MKLLMTLLVRDEQDILAANIEFHLSQGVDFFLITDNLSVDGTRDIAESYVRRGVAQYFFEPGDDYVQHRWVTRMARMAASIYAADWVINSDADEFWMSLAQPSNIKEQLQHIAAGVEAFDVARSNCAPVESGETGSFSSRMVLRERESCNTDGQPLSPKVCHRGFSDIEVEQGNHRVRRGGKTLSTQPGPLRILHYPVRSYAQFENKIKKGGAAYARNRDFPPDVGSTWRNLYEVWRAGGLPACYQKMVITESEARRRIVSGDLLFDDTVSCVLRARESSRGTSCARPGRSPSDWCSASRPPQCDVHVAPSRDGIESP